jgi:hypothetical protein
MKMAMLILNDELLQNIHFLDIMVMFIVEKWVLKVQQTQVKCVLRYSLELGTEL